jgi:hypothetical protein
MSKNSILKPIKEIIMKLTSLVLAVVLSASTAVFAGDKYTPSNTAAASALAGSLSISGALAGSNSDSGASANNAINFEDRLQLPNAPGLSSGSSNSSGKHRIFKQRQGSFLLGGWTNIDMVIDLPDFLGSDPTWEQELGACVQDADYREWRRLAHKAKPDTYWLCPQDEK